MPRRTRLPARRGAPQNTGNRHKLQMGESSARTRRVSFSEELARRDLTPSSSSSDDPSSSGGKRKAMPDGTSPPPGYRKRLRCAKIPVQSTFSSSEDDEIPKGTGPSAIQALDVLPQSAQLDNHISCPSTPRPSGKMTLDDVVDAIQTLGRQVDMNTRAISLRIRADDAARLEEKKKMERRGLNILGNSFRCTIM